MSAPYRLERRQLLLGELGDVFDFFKHPGNLGRITPPWLRFRLLESSDAEVRLGTRIRYRLGLFGIPMTWESLISGFEENVSFVDEQVRGPYRRWRHVHRFRPVPGGVEVADEVEYALPLGLLGSLAHAVFVRRQLHAIFRYRAVQLSKLLGAWPRDVPEALLLDLDGVLADVEDSYRTCTLQTVQSFGARITREELLAAVMAGDANDDWVLAQRLLRERGIGAGLGEVKARYQSIYLGDSSGPGLRERERPIVSPRELERLAARLPVGVVTGRPRAEAEWFLTRFGMLSQVRALVCYEDAAVKPDPAPVRLALARLGVRGAWLVGDTPDDMRAAAAAGVVPLGVVAPADDPSRMAPVLRAAGAALVIDGIQDLHRLLDLATRAP